MNTKDNTPAGGFVVDGLHPDTANLVSRFASALAEKLAMAERKYGWTDHWKSNAWMDQCRQQLVDHVAKGDPRDVAAYCAFLWHHGESTSPTAQPSAKDGVRGKCKHSWILRGRDDHHFTCDKCGAIE